MSKKSNVFSLSILAEYSCKLETDGSMKMTLRSNAYAALVAWEVGVGETNCAATDDGGYQALTIITDSSRVQTTPAIGTADCKVEAPAGDVRKYTLVKRKKTATF